MKKKRRESFGASSNVWEEFTVIRGPFAVVAKAFHPPVNLYEEEDAYVLYMAVSCAERDSIRVEFDGGILRVSGVRRQLERSGGRKVHVMEIFFGPFSREIYISGEIDAAGIQSSYDDGMLRVKLPRAKD